MFLITLDKVSNKNVLKELYLNIGRYKLSPIIHINNIIDLKTKNYEYKNVVSDFITLDIEDLNNYLLNKELFIEDIEDCLYDIVELNKEIVLKNIESSDRIFNLIKSIGIDYIVPEDLLNLNLINFKDIDTNTELIIYDFFDKKHNYRRFYKEEFSIRLTINNEGDVINNGEIKGNLLKDGFKSLFELKKYDFNFSKEDEKEKSLSKLLGEYMYDPHFFLIENINYEEEILKIKKLIFNRIKNVSPDNYLEMKEDLLKLFNETNYIQLSDIKNIIYGNDKFLKLLKYN